MNSIPSDAGRDKFPFGQGNKPTSAMLSNPERLHAEDKPVADLAIKILGKCREAWGPAWAMLPTAVNFIIEGVQRRQDALIADLYSGKITWGAFNAAMDRLNAESELAISSTQSPPTPAAPPVAEKSAKVSEPVTPPPTNQNTPAPNASNKPDASTDQTYQAAAAKAQADCAALYKDPAFDPLRGKIPLQQPPTAGSVEPGNGVTLSEFYNQDVYDTQDSKIGSVKDGLLDQTGQVTAVILGVGGVLGVGEKDVSVPSNAVRVKIRDAACKVLTS